MASGNCLVGFETVALHTCLVFLDNVITFAGILAVEQKTFITSLLFVQTHTAWLWLRLLLGWLRHCSGLYGKRDGVISNEHIS